MRQTRKWSERQKGAAIVEFSLSLLFLVPLLLGTLVFGFRLIRNLEMEQIVRDIGHMYIRGVDFRNSGPQSNAATLAQGFDLSATGMSVLVISQIKVIQQEDCDAANPGKPKGTLCTNLKNPVFTEQLMVGNTSLKINGVSVAKSAFGVPPLQSDKTVSDADQANTATAAAGNTDAGTGFVKVIQLQPGEIAYLTEMLNATPELSITGLTGMPQIYARSVF